MSNEDTNDTETLGKLLPFDAARPPSGTRFATRVPDRETVDAEPPQVVAVVTVTRFIGNEKVHAQVPVLAGEIQTSEMSAKDLKLTPELSELLADGAVEANSYLDRLIATHAARPLRDYCASVNS